MRNFLLVLFALFNFIPYLLADTLSLPIGEFAVISGPIRGRTVSRVLIRFDLSILQGKRVDYAEINIPNFLSEGALTFEGWRLTTNWNRNVKWQSFRRAGGDFDTTHKSHFRISAGLENSVILDITRQLKHWLSRGENYGLLFKRPYYENDGFGIEISRLREVIEQTRLKVYYTTPKE